MVSSRRAFLSLPAMALAASLPNYRVGITTNTRGGWEDDVFLSFREAREVGYCNVESFIHYFKDYLDQPKVLKRKMDDIGVRFVTISNGGGMEMGFEDPSKHDTLLRDHLRLALFIRHFGCDHLKINLGGRRPKGTTDEDLRHIANVIGELGKRCKEEGVKLAIHAHMWSKFENRKEIDFVLNHTDPTDVWFVLDTGHITLAGIDPLELTRKLGHRIVEFHMKDTSPEHRGGAKQRMGRPDVMKDPPFFELGYGGVDFSAIKAHLDEISWRGWLTVELDSSPSRAPKDTARISRRYIEKKLDLSPESFCS